MNRYGAWLAQAKEIPSQKLFYLYSRFSNAEEIYHCPKEQILALDGLTEQEKGFLINYRQKNTVEKCEELLQSLGIEFVCVEDENYPKKLHAIHNPPYGLFFKGSLPKEDKRAVAIVGARARSAYGEQLAQQLAKELSARDVEILSGLALGIDGDAHKGALLGNGNTYGILAGGVETCYPYSHRYLYEKILASGGGILSEFSPGTNPLPFMFPMRNRIISGLADCVIVVEAKEKSGSLITADFAMEQGKDVYALPGRVSDTLSSGCNRLIKQGAGIICSVADFLEEWGVMQDFAPVQLDFRKNLLEKEETLVYSLLDFRPVGIGSLIEQTSYEPAQLLEILKGLEHKGFAEEKFPNYFVRTI